MVYSAIAFLLGCVVVSQLSSIPGWPIWSLLAVMLLVATWQRIFWLAAFIIALFWAGADAQSKLSNSLSSSLTGQDIVVVGQVTGIAHQQDNRLRFLLKPISAEYPLPGKIRLNWYYPPAEKPGAGEVWQFTVRLKPPFGMVNPGSFDYEGWLFQQGIGATGYVRDHAENRLLKSPNWYSVSFWRQSLLDKLHNIAPDTANRALIEGLTLGIRDNMSPEQWQILRSTGTSHLLAISGLHIGLAAAIGFFLGRWLWALYSPLCLHLPAQQFGALVAMLLALAYALLAGMSIPSQRALIMVMVAMSAILMRRRVLSYQLLALTLMAVLIWDPFAVMSAGLWLSFAAVAIIIYVSQNRHPVNKWHWASIHVWIAIGLTPLLLVFFNSTALLSPLANIIAVPLVSLLIVPLLLLGMLVMAFNPSWSAPLWQVADWLLQGLWLILQTVAELPVALWHTASLPFSIIILSLIAFMWLMAPKGWPTRWLGLFLLIPLIFYQPPRPDKGAVWFTLLDVGQGLAAVIETENKTLIFDTGPRFGDFNTGDAVVLPFLQHRGIKQIDMLVVSHGDNDHIGGATAIMQSLPVQTVRTSVPAELPQATACLAGQNWQWDLVHFEFLHPTEKTPGSVNERSCVLKVTGQFGSILLSGDIEKQAESMLLQRDKTLLPADILLVAHHGSNSSSSAAFIDAVSPQVAVVASGFNNRYQFPATEVLRRFQQRDITLFNTADSGALLFRLDKKQSLKPIRWRQQQQRLWRAVATD